MTAFHQLLVTYKKTLLITFSVAVLLVTSITSYFYFLHNNSTPTVSEDSSHASVTFPKDTQLDLNEQPQTLTIALLGLGGPGHQGGHLTDVIQLVHIDFDASQIKMVSIPRDLWVPLPDGSSNKVNAVYAATATPNSNDPHAALKSSLSAISGLSVDYVIAVDFVGYKRAIGLVLEGIEVQVTETLDDPWYPIRGEELNPCDYTPEEIADMTNRLSGFELERQFECRYEHVHFEPGIVYMEGTEALQFVRSRHSSSDFARSARQHAILEAVRDKVISLDGLQSMPALFTKLVVHTQTDLDVDIIKFLVPSLKLAADYETQSVVLSTDNVLVAGKSPQGQFIVTPKAGGGDWSEVQAFIAQ